MSQQRKAPLIKKLELHVYKKGLGLPSMDPECMAVLSFLKFIDRRVTIVESVSSSKPLPHMIINTSHYYGAKSIIQQLKEMQPQFDIDSVVSSKNQSKLLATQSIIVNRLLPCVQHYMWINEVNYPITKQALEEDTPILKRFLAAYSTSQKMRRAIFRRLNGSTDTTVRDFYREDIFKLTNDTLASINGLLLGKTFLFSQDKPCSLDALLFGCLSCLYYPNFDDASALASLTKYPSISEYITTIVARYFPQSGLKLQHVSSTATTTYELLSQERLNMRATYNASLLFLVGSAVALGINFFPGFTNLYLMIRGIEVLTIEEEE